MPPDPPPLQLVPDEPHALIIMKPGKPESNWSSKYVPPEDVPSNEAKPLIDIPKLVILGLTPEITGLRLLIMTLMSASVAVSLSTRRGRAAT